DILNSWWIVLGGAVGLVGLKALILTFLTQRFGATWPDAIKTGAVLSQGGEFAFVVFTLGASSGLFTDGEATLLSAIVTISMVMTPFAMILARQTTPKTAMSEDGLEGPRLNEGHIIVAGFGRMGQIISQVVQNAGVDVTAIDRNPDHIRNAERYGFKVYFGDASRLDLLKTAGAAEARAIILCMDDPEAVNHAVVAIKQSLPSVSVHAIAHDRMHEIQLRRLGPDVIVRETLESSILIARKALEQMNFSDDMIEDFIEQFRERDRERLLQQMDYGPEAGMEIMHQRYVKRDA
ncbi:MAG: NAD-binding protein, partial [Pseudomonadota bacterium]